MKARNADIELKYGIEGKALEDELRLFSTKLSTLAEDDSMISNQLDNLTKQFDERREIVSKRANVQKLLKEEQGTMKEARKKEDELKKNLFDMKEALQLPQGELDDCKKQYELIQKLKTQNDIEEQEILAPAKAEYPKLQEEKQNLAKRIADLHDSNYAAKQALESQNKENSKLLNKLNSEFEEKLAHVENRKAETAKLDKLIDESNALAKKEVEENEKLAMNLNEAIKAQKAINEEKIERKERINRAKLELANKLKRKAYEIALLKLGAEIISKTREFEHEISSE